MLGSFGIKVIQVNLKLIGLIKGEDEMSDEKAIRKLKREKAFWQKVSMILMTKTGIINRQFVEEQIMSIDLEIEQEEEKQK